MTTDETIDRIARIVLEARGKQKTDPLPLVSELVLDQETRDKMGW